MKITIRKNIGWRFTFVELYFYGSYDPLSIKMNWNVRRPYIMKCKATWYNVPWHANKSWDLMFCFECQILHIYTSYIHSDVSIKEELICNAEIEKRGTWCKYSWHISYVQVNSKQRNSAVQCKIVFTFQAVSEQLLLAFPAYVPWNEQCIKTNI